MSVATNQTAMHSQTNILRIICKWLQPWASCTIPLNFFTSILNFFDRLDLIMQVLLIGGSTGTMLEALDVVGDENTSIEVSLTCA
jgi:hypothetical protein